MTAPVLRIADVTQRFGGVVALDGVTLDVAAGVVQALIGPNGAGKSTLLRAVAGIVRPDHGSIAMAGAELVGRPVHAVRRAGVAMALQTPRPLPGMSARDNVALGAMFGTPGGRRSEAAALRAADDALGLVGLGALADRRADACSLHEQRLLDLARAVAGQPRVLLLDEPMAGLTPGELDRAMQVVRDVRDHAGTTVVWVEHVLPAVLDLADTVAVLHLGRLLASGAPGDVVRDPAVLEAYTGQPAGAGGSA